MGTGSGGSGVAGISAARLGASEEGSFVGSLIDDFERSSGQSLNDDQIESVMGSVSRSGARPSTAAIRRIIRNVV